MVMFIEEDTEIVKYCKDGEGVLILSCEGDIRDIDIPEYIEGKPVLGICEGAFENAVILRSIKIPRYVTRIDVGAVESNILSKIVVDVWNEKYKSEGNCIIEKETNKLIVGCKSSIIPKYVNIIGEFAFCGNSRSSLYIDETKKMVDMKIPSSVTSIEEDAFHNFEILRTIEIPRSVTSISEDAFRHCHNLTIYCESESKPSGWKEGWNGYSHVVWGHKMSNK